MLMDYGPLELAHDAIQADGAIYLYADGIFHDRVKIALRQGINLCEAIEEYNDEPEGYFTAGDIFIRNFLDIVTKKYPAVKKEFKNSSKMRNRLEDAITFDEKLEPEQLEELHNYFSLIFNVVTYGRLQYH